MKTAVSIPDDVFVHADRLAERLQTSRSELYARALAEFIARHSEDPVTAALDQVAESLGEYCDDRAAVRAAAGNVLRKSEW